MSDSTTYYLRYPKRTDIVQNGEVITRIKYGFSRGASPQGMLNNADRKRSEQAGIDARGAILIICDDSERT